MTRYVGACACKGIAPKNFKNNLIERNQLISKLMQNRHILRIIEAPSGFGKSCLAAQYANVIFSFKDTFWIDCTSPCFCRDLDSGDLINSLHANKMRTKLVIMDNVQNLTIDRDRDLFATIESLLDAGVEVICTWTPYNRPRFVNDLNYIYISSTELIFKNLEISRHRGNINNKSYKAEENSIFRIPAVTSINASETILLEKIIAEDTDDALTLTFFLVYLYGDISRKGLIELMGDDLIKRIQNMEAKYPQLGFQEGRYIVPEIPVDKILKIFWKQLPLFAKLLNLTSEKLSPRQSCVLLGDYCINNIHEVSKRAFGILRYSCSPSVKMNFLVDNFIYVINKYCWKDALETIKAIPINAVKNYDCLFALNSLLLAVCGEIKQAKKNAYFILDRDMYNEDSKLIASFIFVWFGTQSEYFKSINICSHYSKINGLTNKLSIKLQEMLKDIVNCDADPVNFIKSVNRLDSAKPLSNWRWILVVVKYLKINGVQSLAFDSILGFLRNCKEYLPYEEEIDENYLAYLCVKYCLSIKSALKLYYDIDSFDFQKSYCMRIDSIEFMLMDMFKPQNSDIHIGNLNLPEVSNTNQKIKNIKIHIFGGLKITSNGEQWTGSRLTRQKARILLTILVINHGKDLNKDFLMSLMWPENISADSKKNLNTVISDTRKFLRTIDPRASYLSMSQNSLALNSKYVQTDISSVETLCDALTIGPLNYSDWYEMILQNEDVFRGDLMPSEMSNAYINSKRSEYGNQIVDALVIAGNRLYNAGEIHPALWFGHKAFLRNSEREDVFELLMKAQFATGQRSSAIETYFSCKKYLEENLGLVPSAKIERLYQAIIKE